MDKKAVVLKRGKKYVICCDVDFIPTFIDYVLKDDKYAGEIKQIFMCISEGLKSKKYGDEPFGTKALKPFLNRQNDRIICNVLKVKNEKQHIVMSEIFFHKSSNDIDKELKNRYKIVSSYRYSILSN